MSEEEIVVKIKTLGRGQNELQTTVPKSVSIPELRKRLEELTGVVPSQQRLIYLGKVLKDDKNLSDYNFKAGGTLHMVASANNPVSSPSTSNTQGNQNPAPASTPSVPRGTNVVMGVLPSGSSPNLDQLLNSVLSSVGINMNPSQNSAANSAGQEAQNPPFQSLNNLVRSLENQVNAATNNSVQESPNEAEGNSMERLGTLITRVGNAMNRLQPSLHHVGTRLSNERSLNGPDRVAVQQSISQLVPALQQLGSSLAIISTSLRSAQLGENPGQGTVNDTSSDTHRNFIGPRGNVSVHMGSSGNIPNPNNNSEGETPVNVGNVVQDVLRNLSNAGTSAQRNGPASQPSPAPNANAVPGANPVPDFMNFIGQLASQMDQTSPPTFQSSESRNTPPANPFGNILQNMLSNMPGAGSNTVDMLLQSLLIDRSRSMASFSNMADIPSSADEFTKLVHLFASQLTIGNIVEIYQGNSQSIETLRPSLANHLRELMGNRTEEGYTAQVMETASKYLEEDKLPEEIKNKRKPGCNLTQITIQLLKERTELLVHSILSDAHRSTPEDPYPFSTFLRNWSIDTTGILTSRLADGMVGGVDDARDVIKFFVSQRLYLLHSSFGPMAANLVTPMIDRAYRKYQERRNRGQVDVNATNTRNFRDLDEGAINEIIENDVQRQANQLPQRPFSDAYLQGVTALRRPISVSADELRDPAVILQNHFRAAVEDSGVVNNEDRPAFQSIVEGNDSLTRLYLQQLFHLLRERVRTDPDFDSNKFPNSARVLKSQSNQSNTQNSST